MKLSRLRRKWVIGGAIIIAAIAMISIQNLGNNLVYFYTPAEVFAKSEELTGKTIKIGALVKTGSVRWQPTKLALQFVATDTTGNDIDVSFSGTPPDLFKEGQGVVIEGRIADGGKSISARNLMVKHSEEYKKPESPSSMDRALLEKSLFKN